MTKRDLVKRIARDTGFTYQKVYTIVQSTLHLIIESLKEGNNLELRDFGVFKVVVRNARQGINPNHPQQKINIPAKRVVVFKQGKKMTQIVQD